MSEIKTVSIRGKSYVEVAERVRMVHEQKREFEVAESAPYAMEDRQLWHVLIMVDGKRYRGSAEVKLNAPKNSPDGTNPYECAETSALGRALAFAGFGSVESIASFDEVARAVVNQNAPQSPQNGRSEPQPEQASQSTQAQQDTRKERLNALYRAFYKLNLFEKGTSREESQKNYFLAVSEILRETVATSADLTNFRIEVLEQYLTSKDAA